MIRLQSALLALLLTACGNSAPPASISSSGTPPNSSSSSGTSGSGTAANGDWFGAWSTAHTEARNTAIVNQSLRVITHLTAGGDQVRVKFRNFFGTAPVAINAATVGIRSAGANLVPGTLRTLTFGGSPSVTIANGADVFSDAVALPVETFQDLAVSLFIASSASQSSDANSYLTSYLTAAGTGNHVSDAAGTAFTETTTAAILVEEVAVHNPALLGTLVAVGGSVVDGVGSNIDQHNRWTDWLALRIAKVLPEGQRFAVGNEGISSNTTLDVIARFERDVLDKTGLTHVIVYAGTNDISEPPPVGATGPQLVERYRTLIGKTHAAGKKIVVSTITPRASYTAPGNEARKIANDWIRTGQNCSGECDGIVDFDSVVQWYVNPNAIDPSYDSGDTIHPNGDGYRRMGNNFNLRVFAPPWPLTCSAGPPSN